MNTNQKTVIYIDAEDEITAVIDKVQAASGKIVALVLPKRATVFQSIVNMKLLKRNTETSKKNLVLITSENSVLPLAGAVGIHAAKTLQSKPAIPPPPPTMPTEGDVDSAKEAEPEPEPELDENASIGALAGKPEDETIDIDDKPTAKTKEATKGNKKKRINIPNFNKFRLRLILGGLALLLLLVGWYMAAFVMPQAEISVRTNTQNIPSSFQFTASPAADELDVQERIAPAMQKGLTKTEVERAPATGQRNVGEKATGEIKLKNCSNSDNPVTIPAGTGISSGNFTFITDKSVNLPASSFSGGGNCLTSTRDVDVTAQNPGDNYNLSPRSYQVAGFAGVEAQGSAMTGGTNEVVKVVSQQDIDTAVRRALERVNEGAREEIEAEFNREGLVPLRDTFSPGEPTITPSPAAEAEAEQVSVSVAVAYTMLAVQKDHLAQLIAADVEEEIDLDQQVILGDGVDQSLLQISRRQPNGDIIINLRATVIAGPEINADNLKEEIAGRKRSETETIIRSRRGVTDVTINYSPFWVYGTPGRTHKIFITFQQASGEDIQPDDNFVDLEE